MKFHLAAVYVMMQAAIDAGQTHNAHLSAMRYLTAAGLVIVLHDYVESFPDELQLIWSGRRGLERVLFLVHRHLSVVGLVCAAQMTAGFTEMSDAVCHSLFGCVGVLMIIGICCADVSLEVWILWDLNSKFRCLIALPYLSQCAATVICATWTLKASFDGALSYDPYSNACIFLVSPRAYIGCWASGMAFEMVILVSILCNILHKPRAFDISICKLLFRDACHLMIVLGLRTINLVVTVLRDPTTFFIPAFVTWAIVSVLVNKFVISQSRARRRWTTLVTARDMSGVSCRDLDLTTSHVSANGGESYKISIEINQDMENALI